MKIYTKTGDQGETGLFGADRIAKDHVRIHAYGTVDETNAVLGVVAAKLTQMPELGVLSDLVLQIQHDLFVIGGDLATPEATPYPVPRISDAEVAVLEAWIDRFDAELPPLKHFILPGGHPVAADLHVARTVCRRAERAAVSLMHLENMNPAVLHYLNRLSDLCFVLSRWVNQATQNPEVRWQPIQRG